MKPMKNKPLLLGGGLAVLAVLAWLAFGFFGIQAAFLDDEVSESGPVFTATSSSVPSEAETSASVPSEADQDEVTATAEFQEAMADAEENRTESNETVADVAEDMPGEIVTQFEASFAGESRYTIEGTASVLNNGSEQRFLRFESFASDNGPDLKVYLRAESGDFVSLGDLKGNIGDQNYEIPPGVDLAEFSTIQIWCERFSVNFGSAELTAV